MLVQGTPNNASEAALFINFPGNAFWTTGGGALPHDTGVPLPTFNGDIILRGGIIKLAFTNMWQTTDTRGSDPVRITLFAVWTKPELPPIAFPANVPILWDPSHVPDFHQYGKVLYKKEWLLKGDSEVCELTHRLRTQKIDRYIYTDNGSRLGFFYLLSQTSNTDSSSEAVTVTSSISFSFSADATS